MGRVGDGMILSKRWGIKIAHVYCHERPSAGADIVHFHQLANPLSGCDNQPFATILIDLRKTPAQLLAEMGRETRRLIRRGETSPELQHQYWREPDEALLREYVQLQQLSAAAKHLYQKQDDLDQLLAAGQLSISMVREDGGQPLVWRAYYRISPRIRAFRFGTLHMQADDAARRQFIGKASRFGLWRDMRIFQEEGFETFDLAGWYTGTTDEEKLRINLFKQGFGGAIVTEYDCLQAVTWEGRLALAASRAFGSPARAESSDPLSPESSKETG